MDDRRAQSEAELAAIYENAPILMCALDRDRRVLRANKAFTDLTGVTEAALKGGTACGIFGCINAADDSRGCGFGPTCDGCALRNVLDDTSRTGTPHRDVEYRATLETARGRQERVFLGSTVRIDGPGGPEVLLCLLDVSDRARALEALDDSRAKLRSLARHLLSAREEERRKVAQEIHDELGQLLTGLGMDLRWAVPRLTAHPAERAKLEASIPLVDSAIRIVQRVSAELRPRMLDDLGLAAALEWLAGDFTRRHGIPCTAEVAITDGRIGGNAGTAIFRIVQEALTNVARHARAARASLLLRETPIALEVQVVDDGVGITEEQASGPRSFGLIGLRERVQSLNGTALIEGRPEGGTRVAVTIPFPDGRNLA